MSKGDKIMIGSIFAAIIVVIGGFAGWVIHWNATHPTEIAVFDTAEAAEQAVCNAEAGPEFRPTYVELEEDGDYKVDVLPMSRAWLPACVREHWITANEVVVVPALPDCNRQRAYEDLARLGKLSGETLAACGIHET